MCKQFQLDWRLSEIYSTQLSLVAAHKPVGLEHAPQLRVFVQIELAEPVNREIDANTKLLVLLPTRRPQKGCRMIVPPVNDALVSPLLFKIFQAPQSRPSSLSLDRVQ
jgi:hypothetical protein